MGKLALAGIHPEGTPLGEFADAAWAVQVDYILAATQESAEIVDALWDKTVNPAVPIAAEPDRDEQLHGPTTRDEHGPPSPDEILAWASNPRAQAGQRALMGQTGGAPQAGAAPGARR